MVKDTAWLLGLMNFFGWVKILPLGVMYSLFHVELQSFLQEWTLESGHSESLPTLGAKYEHISNLNPNSNSQIPVFEVSDFSSQQSEGLDTRKSDQGSGTIWNIPMYKVSITLKTNGLKPTYMNEKASLKNRNKGLQNKLKLRVNQLFYKINFDTEDYDIMLYFSLSLFLI